MKMENTHATLLVLIVLYSISLGVFFINDSATQAFTLMKILPLAYSLGVTLLLVIRPSFTMNLIKVLIVSVYGARMFLYPIFALLSNVLGNTNPAIYDNIPQAVALQCYEFLVVVMFLSLNNDDNYGLAKTIEGIGDYNINKVTRRVLGLLIFVSILLLLSHRNLMYIFRPIAFSNNSAYIHWKIINGSIKGTMPKAMYYLSQWLIVLMKILIVYLLAYMLKTRVRTKRQESTALFISLILSTSLVLIVTDDQAGSIYAFVAFLFLLARLYPAKRKFIVRFMVTIVAVTVMSVLIIGPLIQHTSSNYNYYIGEKLNAYFSGSVNIAASFRMSRQNIFSLLLGDFLRSTPLVKGYFSHMGMSNIIFNQELGSDTVYNSQIIPNIGQGAFYLGPLLSPLFSIVIIYIAIKSYRKANASDDTLSFFIYTYLSIFCAVAPIVYNLFLVAALIMQYILPMFTIYWLCRRRKPKTVYPGKIQ